MYRAKVGRYLIQFDGTDVDLITQAVAKGCTHGARMQVESPRGGHWIGRLYRLPGIKIEFGFARDTYSHNPFRATCVRY